MELPLASEMKALLRASDRGTATATTTSWRSSPAACGTRVRAGGGAVSTRQQDSRLARRDAGGGLGAAHRLPAAALGPARSRQGGARGLRPRRAAALRPEQHPLRHEHAHRRVGARQERALRAPAARRRSDPLGLRLGGPPSPAVRAVAARRRTSAPASRRCAARCPSRPASPTGSASGSRTSCASSACRTSRSASTWPTSSRSRRCSAPGVHVTDGSQVMLEARKIKTAAGDRAARPVGRARRRRLRGDLPDAAAGRLRARDRRARAPAAVRDGLGAGRGGQRRLGRPLQPAPARVLRPAAAPGRPGVLRHHPLVHGLPDVLLPHVQRRRRQPVAARRVQAVPRVAGRRDRARPARA